jgi:hypothetical protein
LIGGFASVGSGGREENDLTMDRPVIDCRGGNNTKLIICDPSPIKDWLWESDGFDWNKLIKRVELKIAINCDQFEERNQNKAREIPNLGSQ